jgi:hypothetical protein
MATVDQHSLVRATAQVTIASVARPGKSRNEDLVGVLGPYVWLLDATSPRGRSCCGRDGA